MADDAARKLILARRARFVATALAGVATAATLTSALDGCGGETADPGQGGGRADASAADGARPQPCLEPRPEPCLSPRRPDPIDAGGPDAADAGADAQPQPCLLLPIDGG